MDWFRKRKRKGYALHVCNAVQGEGTGLIACKNVSVISYHIIYFLSLDPYRIKKSICLWK